MKRVVAVAAAMVLAASVCFAEEAKPAGEKAAPKPEVKSQAKPARPAGAAQEEMWKAAGCSEEEIAKLKELRDQLKEARKAKDEAKVKEIQGEIDKIMTPERRNKVRQIFMERRAKAIQSKDATTTK